MAPGFPRVARGHTASVEPEPAPHPEPATAPAPVRWWRTERGTAVVFAVVVALVLGLVAAVVGVATYDDRPRAAVGDLFDSPEVADPLPHVADVLLPWTHLEVSAGEPTEELPEPADDVAANVRAPVGGRFVRVDVTVDTEQLIPLPASSAPFSQETELVLRADGRDYPLDDEGGLVIGPNEPYDQGGTRWVAVDGVPSELEVLVTVDGLTQVVDASDGSVERGRAAELADLPSQRQLTSMGSVPCGDERRVDDGDVRVDYPRRLPCRVDVSLRTPYVDGLGWAEPGREYLLVHLVTVNTPGFLSLETGRGDDTEYWDVARLRVSPTLGTGPPTSEADVNSLNQGPLAISDPDQPQQYVYDVPAGEPVGDLRISVVAHATLGAPFVTDRERLEFRWTVPGGELA